MDIFNTLAIGGGTADFNNPALHKKLFVFGKKTEGKLEKQGKEECTGENKE